MTSLAPFKGSDIGKSRVLNRSGLGNCRDTLPRCLDVAEEVARDGEHADADDDVEEIVCRQRLHAERTAKSQMRCAGAQLHSWRRVGYHERGYYIINRNMPVRRRPPKNAEPVVCAWHPDAGMQTC